MPAPSAPIRLRVEHLPAGPLVLGVGTPAPRLSWQVPSARPGWTQTGYELEVDRDGEVSVDAVGSDEQVGVPWPGAPLASRGRATVRVRVRGTTDGSDGVDGSEAWSGWSEPVVAEAGLLEPSDWQARFVTPVDDDRSAAPVLVGRVEVPDGVVSARLRASAHGLYVVHLDGVRVGDEQLAPGWTAYDDRLRYRTHDVTDLLRPGTTVVEVVLGNGWYRGRLGFLGQTGLYGDRLALLLQLELTTADGRLLVHGTDGTWQVRRSHVLADDLYDGQTTDLRLPMLGDPYGPHGRVEVLDDEAAPLRRLVAPEGPEVRVTQVVPAVAVTTSPSGSTLVDFGQNLVGWVRLCARGTEAGQEVVVRHAEVLEDGELGVRPLRTARATDRWTCAGAEVEDLEPSLTFHGFRYAEVTGVADLRAEDVEAVVVGSDLERTGWFSSSEPMLDRFHENVVWGMRGNFVDVPTDCPQRDERLGWTGDIQVFCPTASFLFDCAGFLSSWLGDLSADQQDDGSVPYVVPDVIRSAGPAAAAWSDAATVVPSVLHERFADVEVLRRQLPSMQAWVDRVTSLAGADGVWAGGFQFGDWLDPTAPPEAPFAAKADPDVIAQAYYVRSAQLLARAARTVGERDLAERYDGVAASALRAFQEAFVTPSGRVLSDSATTYALALCWDLLPDERARTGAADRLADLVRSSGFRISTGFVGTPLVTDALTDAGHADLAYRLLLQQGCPSWLYSVAMGATTVWERWDSMLPDGSINPGEMTSFNHYALGAVADWLHRRVAGLAPAAPGYRRISVRPVPHRSLTRAEARHMTPYGEASVGWRREDGTLVLRVVVPVGATAQIDLPGLGDGTGALTVGHGEHSWQVPDVWGAAPEQDVPASVRAVVDDERRWQAVVAEAVAAGVVVDDTDAAGKVAAYLDHPPRVLGQALDFEGFASGALELTERLQAAATGARDEAFTSS